MKNLPPQLDQKLRGDLQNLLQALGPACGRITETANSASLYEALEEFCLLSRNLAGHAHALKMAADWRAAPTPEWFDHFIDQFMQTRQSRATLWMERGVYAVAALKKDGDFLELCCGDGYNTFHFYSPFARTIVAVDFDDTALRHARKFNAAQNIDYRKCDIRTDMPEGRFSNILWDAAVEHFTEAEIAGIMAGIHRRLEPGGILSGYTLVEKETGEKHLHQHEREFRSMADLQSLLTPYFKNVRVFETFHPQRHNLYFYASDGAVPFDDEWPHSIRHCTR